MKLKVTLRAPTGDRDVLLTVDGGATVGDVAGFLTGTPGLTLRVTPPATGQPVMLNPLGSVIIVESDTVSGAQAWQIYNELKTARAGIILQPEETDGTLFRVQLPRVTRADFPVGRGILVDAGRINTVQVAT